MDRNPKTDRRFEGRHHGAFGNHDWLWRGGRWVCRRCNIEVGV